MIHRATVASTRKLMPGLAGAALPGLTLVQSDTDGDGIESDALEDLD